MKPITLSIFFPAYNEEANIADAVTGALQVANESPFVAESEIIVVNDGSTDRTKEVVEEVIAAHPDANIRLINHDPNKGYGASLRTGLSAARMEYVFFTDSDLQFDIIELQNLLVHLPKYEVVVGYRAPRRDPFMRILNAKGWNFLNRFLFGLRISDIDCAFKVFKRELVQHIELQSNGAMLSAELLIRLKRDGIEIKEVPVSHLPRTRGSATGAKLSVIMRALREMFALYMGDLGLATHKQLVRFATVGVLNTLIDIVAYVVLTRETVYFSLHLNIAKLVSFFLGTLSSLVLNRTWTFGLRTRPRIAEVLRFYANAIVAVIVNVAIMNVFLMMGMYDLVALALTTVLTFGVNFTISKFWVFRKKESVPTPELAYQ